MLCVCVVCVSGASGSAARAKRLEQRAEVFALERHAAVGDARALVLAHCEVQFRRAIC